MSGTSRRFKLNKISVDADGCTLTTETGVQRLPMRLMKLLCLLKDAGGATVAREALINTLWPRGFVNEEALSRAVAELRQHLGDDARRPSFIETIPKQGYRLVATVSLENAQVQDPGRGFSLTQASTSTLRRGLAVVVILTVAVVVYFNAGETRPLINPAVLASATRLSADSIIKHHPEISPDGHWLAYVRARDGNGQLVIVSTASPTERWEIESEFSILSPVFDPTSSQLAVAAVNDQGCQVMRYSINGGEPVPLGPCSVRNLLPILDWSSNGSMLAYVDTDPTSNSAAIWVMTLADGERTRVTAPPDAYSFDTRPRFSPDASKLSFSRGTRAAREIWVLDLPPVLTNEQQLPEPRQLSFDHQYTTSHDWMPDGQALLLDSERSGHRALWLLDLEGKWTLLGARDADTPSLAGNRLVFRISQYEANIWRLNKKTGKLDQQPLIASNKYDSNPVWSPDGQEIAFSSNRTDTGSIWIASADGTRERLVYAPPDGRVVWPSWSPDGTFLIATQYSRGGQNLVKIALNQREVVIIPTAGERPYGGTYSADGRWLYYVAGAGEVGTRLWRQASDNGGEAIVLFDRPVNNFHIVASQWVFYTKHNQQGLFRAPLAGPSEEKVFLLDLPRSAWNDWTGTDQWIYFPVITEPPGVALMRKPVEGGRTEKISDEIPTALGPNLDVQPGSDNILMVRTDRTRSDLFLVDLKD